jgi:hypothetical protein
MDADIPFDPDVLGRAIRAMELTDADMIAAYRHDRTMEGFKRGVYTLVYNWLIGCSSAGRTATSTSRSS